MSGKAVSAAPASAWPVLRRRRSLELTVRQPEADAVSDGLEACDESHDATLASLRTSAKT
jgi:hypothetical protein